MVSLTSIVMLALVAAAQMVNSAPTVPQTSKLPICDELDDLTSDNTNVLKSFKHQQDKAPIGWVYEDSLVRTRRSKVTNKKITTVKTGALKADQRTLQIEWQVDDNDSTTRFFDLKPFTTCRVANSASYDKITSAAYVEETDYN